MDMIGAPSFIRNIVSVPCQLESLIVPEAFVEDNPTLFLGCNSVILQIPGGREYEVEIRREAREILFSSGWKDFAEHYELDLGYFLVFRYRGNSRFQVGVLDTSDCDIDYAPFHCQCLPEPVQADEEEEEVEENTKIDEEEENEVEENTEIDEEGEDEVEENTDKGKESIVLERAELYHCNGPSFIVTMKASYHSMDYRMWVPRVHARRYLKDGKSKVNLVVDVTNGGTATWKVNVISGLISRFGSGWKKFVRDNRLNEDDVCKFELIDHEEQTYKVHIFGV